MLGDGIFEDNQFTDFILQWRQRDFGFTSSGTERESYQQFIQDRQRWREEKRALFAPLLHPKSTGILIRRKL
jgi:hypothetical protein